MEDKSQCCLFSFVTWHLIVCTVPYSYIVFFCFFPDFITYPESCNLWMVPDTVHFSAAVSISNFEIHRVQKSKIHKIDCDECSAFYIECVNICTHNDWTWRWSSVIFISNLTNPKLSCLTSVSVLLPTASLLSSMLYILLLLLHIITQLWARAGAEHHSWNCNSNQCPGRQGPQPG